MKPRAALGRSADQAPGFSAAILNMTPCDALLGRLSEDRLTQTDREHAAGCASCGPLLPRDAAPPEPDASEIQRIRARLHAELPRSPVRPWHREAWLLAAVNAAVVAALVIQRGPVGWQVSTTPVVFRVVVAAVLAAFCTLGAWLALAPGGRWPRQLLGLSWLIPIGVLVAGDRVPRLSDVGASLPCTLTVLGASVLPMCVALLAMRHSAPDVGRSLAVGSVAGLAGVAALDVTCPDGSWRHILGFHLLPWAVLVLAAVAIRRRLPTWSWAP